MNNKRTKNVFNNSSGSTIVIVMLILAVLTILGISSINTSTIELKISRNERIYHENFYQAEAAAMEGAQALEATPEDDLDNRELNNRNTSDKWLNIKKWLEDNDVDLANLDDWDISNPSNTYVSESQIINDSGKQRVIARFSAVEETIAKGASLDMSTKDNMYDFTVRGLCDDSANNNGYVLIEIGYKKRH